MKKVGVVHTSSNNAEKLLEIAAERYPDMKVVNIVDEALWELVLDAEGKMTERCKEILAHDFNRLAEAGCEAAGLLCSLVKEGIDDVRKHVSVPVFVYDDEAVKKAVSVSKDGDTIAIIALRKTPLPIAAKSCEKEIQLSRKNIHAEQIVVEGGSDDSFVQYLHEHQNLYSAYVVPQVPLSRVMPQLRDLSIPVYDSMEYLLEVLHEAVSK